VERNPALNPFDSLRNQSESGLSKGYTHSTKQRKHT